MSVLFWRGGGGEGGKTVQIDEKPSEQLGKNSSKQQTVPTSVLPQLSVPCIIDLMNSQAKGSEVQKLLIT